MKNKLTITCISDTHTKHRSLNLPGGDILIHAGDLMNSGWNMNDIHDFLKWFENQNYNELIFIAGNHDRRFETDPIDVKAILENYPLITYLEDRWVTVEGVKIYGSPWQPEFYNWAFNLPRCGEELERKWEEIPEDTDILITHGPPQDHLDISGPPYNQHQLGCELLRVKVDKLKPKIHVFGHIHGSSGYKEYNSTHFINASILNEDYVKINDGVTLNWCPETNEAIFI
jgi:Icc-related predicted phosphoesterase